MKIALDMDGVIADFESYVRNDMGLELPPYEDKSKMAWKNRHKVFNAIRGMGTEFWENLPKMPDFEHLMEEVHKHDFFILTAHLRDNANEAKIGKMKWVRKHIGDISEDRFICCWKKDKQEHINHLGEPALLIDDSFANIERWTEVGGKAIHHSCPFDTVKQLKVLY